MTPDANFLLQVLLAIGFLMNLSLSGATLLGLRKSQKREISFTEAYATRAELAALEHDMEKIDLRLTAVQLEMKQDREAVLVAGEKRAEKIHARIDLILEAVSELRGKVNA